jgi:quercetin dioxygenase-like cupin family protein
MIEIKKMKLADAPRVPFNLDGRILLASEKNEVIHLVLKPGEGMDLHTQPVDVIFFVVGGNGILRTADKPVEGEPGSCIQVPAGVQRGWMNNSNAELRILVIKILK